MMKLTIGKNLKRLRREKNITQDQLADILGVSYQSVSRWETGLCYPDIELLPTISDFFGVSVDKLIGVDKSIEQKKTEEYLESFQNAISQGNVYDCIAIARKGVSEFPNNFVLLNKLMYALFISGDEDGNIPEWKENKEKYDTEIIALGERIMKYCPDQNIRLEATARLAFHHCEMGRKTIGRAIFETLPSMEYCKESNIWWGLNDNEKLPYTRERIRKGYETMSAGIYSLLCYQQLPDEELIKIYEKKVKIDELVHDGQMDYYNWGNARFYCNYAKALARLSRYDEALKKLKIAVQCAIKFDNRPDKYRFSSLLLGEITISRTDFETDDDRTFMEMMKDKWFASSDFDQIRHTEDFKKLVAQLSNQ